MTEEHAQSLETLAGILGVTRCYHDGTGRLRRASDDAVLAVLRALGAPVERPADATDALREAGSASWASRSRIAVLAGGEGGTLEIAHTGGIAAERVSATLLLESGEKTAARVVPGPHGGLRVHVPLETPAGYHHLDVEHGQRSLRMQVLVAPPRLPEVSRSWCVFAPLYGLSTGTGPHAATYGDLARLGQWMTQRSGRSDRHRDAALLGTLPLLACFFEDPFEPSPYSPISRAFWSELYVDPTAAPEFVSVEQRTPPSAPAAAGPRASFVDYRAIMRERRRQIETLLDALDGGAGTRRDAFELALEEDGELSRYAGFRAAVELYGTTWQTWPARARAGSLRAGVDYDGEAFRYHAYAQWLAREQFADAAAKNPAGLYLDLPLGSHGGGYDTWRYPDDFAHDVAVGAPPDAVFEGGQNWGFPPLHPERLRSGGFASVRAALRRHFEHAAVLRVDHVMGMHRSFWIPEGFDGSDGVYVRSPHEELWTVLAIEAARARGGRGAGVVGEDLGTVPDEVRAEMQRRGALRMHVIPFECRTDEPEPVVAAPRSALACLGTHDMEPFATWWEDARTRREDLARFLGCTADAAAALAALLAWLSAGAATVVCTNLEDLWLERERQNMPGAAAGDRNWQRPFSREFDDFSRDPHILHLLDVLQGSHAAPAGRSR